VLLIEQNARAALETADYAYVMETGKVVYSGVAAALWHDPTLAATYLSELDNSDGHRSSRHFPSGERTLPAMLAQQASRYGGRALFAAGDVSWICQETRTMAACIAGPVIW